MTAEERKVIFASSLGTVFEWYDFYLYGSLAAVIAKQFFSGLDAGSAFIFALLAFAVTLPLWWLPFMALLLPPLIWGWLTYRVMVYDVLAEHASQAERIELISRFRFQLLGIGVITGMMGAAPSLIWASGALFAAAFVVLIPVAVWIYTLVFIFSSLWFAHFLIQALDELRQETFYEHTIDI
jgi:hypothetical protein